MTRRTVVFRNSGYVTGWGYRKELKIQIPEKKFKRGSTKYYYYVSNIAIGRETYLATAIEKFIIRENFLSSGKRVLQKRIAESRYKLLLGMLELGTAYWQLWEKAVKEKWTQKKLIGKIFYKVL